MMKLVLAAVTSGLIALSMAASAQSNGPNAPGSDSTASGSGNSASVGTETNSDKPNVSSPHRRVPRDRNASPSGTGMTSNSPTTGTANYPTDPNAASPSATGNKSVAGEQGEEAKGNGQAKTDADSAGPAQPSETK